MKLAVGSDKSGFSLKERIREHLTCAGHEVADLGTTDPGNFLPYFEVAKRVARAVQAGEVDRAVLCCGTGQGMAIAANKFRGVYATPVESVYSAGRAAIINRSNVLALGGWVTAPEAALEMVDEWLRRSFGEGFPEDRQKFLANAFEHVRKIESENFGA